MEQDMKVEKSEHAPIETMENERDPEKKRKREAIFEMALFFILGVLVGITLKTEAVKSITIGFNDYQIPPKAQRYDVDALKKNLDRQIQEQQSAQQQLQQQEQASPQQNQPQQ